MFVGDGVLVGGSVAGFFLCSHRGVVAMLKIIVEGMLEQPSSILFAAADIFMRKNKKMSGGVPGDATAAWVLFELMEYHLLTHSTKL